MAETSFCFNNDNDDNRLSPFEGECLELEEEEYDALNDETFGAFEDSTSLDDWEQEHEKFATEIAQYAENNIESCLKDLEKVGLFDSPKAKSDFSDLSDLKSLVNIFDSNSSLDVDHIKRNVDPLKFPINSTPISTVSSNSGNESLQKKFCTVEELERGLLQQDKLKHNSSSLNVSPTTHSLLGQHRLFPQQSSQHHSVPIRYGIPPGLPPPGLRHLSHHPPPPFPNLPSPLVQVVPPVPYMYGNHTPLPTSMYSIPVNHPYNFPPPPRIGNINNLQQQQIPNILNNSILHHQQHHKQQKPEINNLRQRNEYYEGPSTRDEYAGLMSNREKQWLINIQLVQLNTGTPFFDDYYYTIYKERKLKNTKENQPLLDRRYRRNSDRPENQTTLTPKTYTPLQFENSLGKLQCSSVTAPRKIIDMDIVTPDKDGENGSVSSKDSKKTKQILLELEAFYTFLLKVEDLKNPMYKTNMEKLCEIKQKQRLRELDLATTPEQKREILQYLRQDCEPLNENPMDYLNKVIYGLFQEDKYINFLSIRKGKTLLLRLLPHLTQDQFSSQLLDIWIKVFLSIPIIGRKDASGDNLLIRLHPHFKRFLQASETNAVLELASSFLEVTTRDGTRNTPISCQSKQLLSSLLTNKFGISSLATLLIKAEYLIASDKLNEKQLTDWSNFIVRWIENLSMSSILIATPLEPISPLLFNKHSARIKVLSLDQIKLLEKCLVHSNDGSDEIAKGGNK